jgi:hypothetical protein
LAGGRVPDQDDEGEQAAIRLERALDRIENVARRPGAVPARRTETALGSAEAASRIDALIARLDAALDRDH